MSAESSVKRHLTPINAHQQKSVPLLRRPRPPKQTKTKLSNSNASSETTSKSEYGAALTANHTQDCIIVHPTPYTADSDSTFTIYPRGTSLLPPGKVLRSNHQTRFVEESQTEQVEFTLNDFQLSAEALHQVMPNKLRGAVISRQNYLKLTSWFAANVPKQKAINTVNLEGKCIHSFMQPSQVSFVSPPLLHIVELCVSFLFCYPVDHEAPDERKPMHQMLLGELLVHCICQNPCSWHCASSLSSLVNKSLSVTIKGLS